MIFLRFSSESDLRRELLRRAIQLREKERQEGQREAGSSGCFGVSSTGYWGGIGEREAVRRSCSRRWDKMLRRAKRYEAAAEALDDEEAGDRG